MAIKMMSLQSMCWLIACLAIQPSAATSKVDCKWGWDGVTCTETNHEILKYPLFKTNVLLGDVIDKIRPDPRIPKYPWLKTKDLLGDVIDKIRPDTSHVEDFATWISARYKIIIGVVAGIIVVALLVWALNRSTARQRGGQPSQVPTGGMNDNPEFVNTAQTKI
ncbi:uncharacterized protein LOC144601585 [Rhinoraja longicauda]